MRIIGIVIGFICERIMDVLFWLVSLGCERR